MNRLEQNPSIEETGPQAGPFQVQSEATRDGLLQVVWRRRWIVLGVTIASLVVAVGYLIKATPIYTSTSRLYVEQSGPKIVSQTEGYTQYKASYLYTQVELLRSMPIVAAAVDGPELKQLKTFAGVDNPVGLLKGKLEADVGKKDDIINVSFSSPYPQEAARIVNAVVDSYVTYNAQKKKTTAGEILKILQKEKIKRDQEQADKLKAMLDFKQANPALSFEDQKGNIIVQRLSRLSEAMTAAQLDTIDAKVGLEATKAIMNAPANVRQLVEAQRAKGVYISTEREDTEVRSELNRLQLQLDALKRDYTDEHPVVQAVKDQIDKLKARLDDLEKKFASAQLSVAEQQYAAAQQKESQIESFFEEQRSQTLGLNAQIAQHTLLQSDWEGAKKLCDVLNDRIKEINVNEEGGALNITILEAAKAEDSPSSPNRPRVMTMALALGLILGTGLVVLLGWMDQRLRSSEEIAAVLGVPVLGVVPHMAGKESQAVRGQKVHLDPTSNTAEAYRTIRTAVFFGVPEGQARTLLVTSSAPGDGKSTVVGNLAIAMAQAGQRVLIIDGDFRKPMQHVIFEVKDDAGLSSVLAGRAKLDQTIQHTHIEHLDVLPCGPIPPNPSEMLNSKAFAETLKGLADKYDHVLVDSPPVMPVTDARILGAMCNEVILVVRAEKSTRKAAEQAREGMLSVGAHILGVVVNDAPHRRGHYGYNSGYGYYGYGYGHYGRDRESSKSESPETVASGNGKR